MKLPRFEPGFETESNIVHFTRSLLGMTAICGHYPVDMIGLPDDGELCEECTAIVQDEGEERLLNSLWLKAGKNETA